MTAGSQAVARRRAAKMVTDPAPNAFIGRSERPSDADLRKALGSASTIWESLIDDLGAECGVTAQEWSSYSAKAGWTLRLKRGKRTIVWLAPCEGCFRVAFILGDKALSVARHSDLSGRALQLLDEGQKYPEGTGVRLIIKGTRDIPTVKKLAAIKLQC